MRTDLCQCGQTLFFESTTCLNCGLPTGWCEECRRMAALIAAPDGTYRCHHGDCQAKLHLCHNYAVENTCNWTVSNRLEGNDQPLCASCQLTTLIPNLSVPENQIKWCKLEAAKRRLLYSLDLIGLPYRDTSPPLQFHFLEGTRASAPIHTGHDNGCVTINLREADDVEREKARVKFHEPQRTLVGHLRHEIGHYYWEVLVTEAHEPAFRELFGDERSPAYAEALQTYYQSGPPADFQNEYVSAYASMHPWEDFAETFEAYLEMISLLDTAEHHHLIHLSTNDFPRMVAAYGKLGIVLNEMNRERGLLDLVPEVFSPKVVEKLRFIHELIRQPSQKVESF